MNLPSVGGWQLHRKPWPLDRLVQERVVALGSTLDTLTLQNYNSALTSFLTFIRIHNMQLPPTEDFVSFYIVFMSQHISLQSVMTYLSGIVQQLKPFYPAIREIHHSKLVQRTLKGAPGLINNTVGRNFFFRADGGTT
jgi:hypothetical protein